jgi:YD repeat-containing protein
MDTNKNGARLRRISALATFFLIVAFAFGLCAPVSHADDIEYAYDEAGRLVQASNLTSGEAVRYTYDAAGNITSQISGPLTTLAIGHFSPRRGPAGTQVTINGTGFAATPAGNYVRFGGVVADIISATQTKIIAVVPASAVSGPIGVEVAAATVTSAEVFVVTATSDGPSISALLPSVSSPGNLVTIVGANFEPVPSRNRVRFNNTSAEVVAATESMLTAVVPQEAGSGKIKVTTSRGVAVSPSEFVVLPAGYAPTTLANVDRVGGDGTTVVSIGTANTYGARVFEGKAGDLLTIALTASTGVEAQVRVFAPDNIVTPLVQGTLRGSAPGLQVPKLTVTGTYTMFVFPSAVGSVTLSVLKPTTAALTLGAPIPVNITLPGRRALLTFTVPSDTYADVTVSGVTLQAGTLSLLAPGGAVVKSQSFTTAGLSMQPLLKPAGEYALLFDPTGSIAGSLIATVNLSSPAGLQRNMSREFAIDHGNQIPLTFRGEAGEYVSIAAVLNAPSAFSLYLQVKAPDGTILSGSRSVGTIYADLGRQHGAGVWNLGPLPSGGTYTAIIQRSGGSSSTVRLTLSSLATASLPATGGAAAITVAVPGQPAMATFKAGVGEFLSLAVSEDRGVMSGAFATVINPDGTTLPTQDLTITPGAKEGAPGGGTTGDGPYRHGTKVINLGPLPMTGTYRLLLQQKDILRKLDGLTGQWLLTLSKPVPGTLAINGPIDRKRMLINGQGVLYSFDAAAGAVLSLGLETDEGDISDPNTMDAMAISVFDPDGMQVADGAMSVRDNANGQNVYGSTVVNIGPLPTSGRHKIFLQQLGDYVRSIGGVKARLSYPLEGPMSGAEALVDRLGQGVGGTFTAAAGEYRTVRAETAGRINASRIRVLAPDHSRVDMRSLSYTSTSTTPFAGRGLLNVGPLPMAGNYRVLVEQTGAEEELIGAFKVELSGPVTGVLPDGVPVDVSLPWQGQSLQYTFAAERGSYRSVLVSETNGPIITASIAILDPLGVPVGSGGHFSASQLTSRYSGRALLNVGPLPVTGNYSVLVRQIDRIHEPATTPGVLTVAVASPLRSQANEIDIGHTGQAALHTFTGTVGQNVSLTVTETDDEITHAGVKLLAPNGTVLKTGTMNLTRCPTCVGYSGGAALLNTQLPATGTYGVLVQQAGFANNTVAGTGTLRFSVGNRAPDAGSTSNIATTTPGQFATTTYNAVEGESFSVAFTSAAQSPASATVYAIYVMRPGGSSAIAGIPCETTKPGCELALRNVDATGTYEIQVRPASNATITGVLTVAPFVTGELALDMPTPVALGTVGQAALLSFVTTTTRSLSVSLDNISTTPANTKMHALVVNAVSGHSLKPEITVATGGSINLPDLAPGAYYVWIRPQYPATSNLQVTLRSFGGGTALNVNTPVNFTNVSPGHAVHYTFEAQAGDNIGVALTNIVATPAPNNFAQVTVYGPDGTSLRSDMICQNPRCTWPLRNLTKSGTYLIRVEPSYENVNLSATLTVSKGLTGTLALDQPFDLNLNVPGRLAQLRFTTSGGQHLSFNIGGLTTTPAGSSVTVAVEDSAGKPTGIISGASTELHNLPMGTYSVWITQPLAMTGSMQVTLKSTPVAADAAPLSINAGGGQAMYFTFDALAGDSMGLALTDIVANPARTTNFAYVDVFEPGGTRAMDTSRGATFGTTCQELKCAWVYRNLAKTGTYRVRVRPYDADFTLAATLTVSKAITGTLTPDQPVDVNFDVPGRAVQFTFTASGGQHYSVNIDGLTSSPAGSAVGVRVYDSMANAEGTTTRTATELENLAPDTYFVWLTQPSPMTGSMRVTLKTIPKIAANGAGVPVHNPTQGQPSYFTFDALAGESFGVALTDISTAPPSTTNFVMLHVFEPGALSLASETCQATRCLVQLRNVAKSGSYRIRVEPYWPTMTASATLTLTKAVTGTLTGGQPFELNLGSVGQPALLSFSRPSTGPLSLNISSINPTPAGTSYRAYLYNAANGQVTWGASSSALTLSVASLPAGSYTLWIYPTGAATATMNVSF